jgi:hypothetical protein
VANDDEGWANDDEDSFCSLLANDADTDCLSLLANEDEGHANGDDGEPCAKNDADCGCCCLPSNDPPTPQLLTVDPVDPESCMGSLPILDPKKGLGLPPRGDLKLPPEPIPREKGSSILFCPNTIFCLLFFILVRFSPKKQIDPNEIG